MKNGITAYKSEDVYVLLREHKLYNGLAQYVDVSIDDYEKYLGSTSGYLLDSFRLKKGHRIVWPYKGVFYRPEGLLKIAHESGNTELKMTTLRSRLHNIMSESDVAKAISTPKQHKLGHAPIWGCQYRYMGKNVHPSEIIKMATERGHNLTKGIVKYRLKQGWSVYQTINTPEEYYKMPREQQRQIQYNLIADLIEKRGRDKGLKIWLGKY